MKRRITRGVSWKELYDKSNRPDRTALNNFWRSNVRQVFVELSNTLHRQYGLALTNLTYTKTHGWIMKFTKSGIVLVKKVIFEQDAFYIDHISVNNAESMQTALEYVESLYTPDFLKQFQEKIETRNKKQVERSKRSAQNEKNAINEIVKIVGNDKLNQFKWSPKLSQRDLKRLYREDAKMIYNDELVDEVGYTLYARCIQGRDERLLANENKLKCHNCGNILSKTNSQILQCDCGHHYVFREYMRSFNKNSMPSRSATPFFNDFINRWPFAKSYHEKMQLIDWVIHQCHLNMLSGVKRGFAGLNLIEGSKEEVRNLILELAYN
ncbi:MAG: hypothetical protein LBM69_04560 [Lachnospiraceae bacterium]|nr:hypothetical protein [Lachnospiraceae bacterium]